jgi:hypothetical protein
MSHRRPALIAILTAGAVTVGATPATAEEPLPPTTHDAAHGAEPPRPR